MRFDVDELTSHLQKLYAGGGIEEAVLEQDLSAAAMAPDQSMAVFLPSFDEEELFPTRAGVTQLQKLIQAARMSRTDEVDISVEAGDSGVRINVDVDDAAVTLVSAVPKYIQTEMEAEAVEAIESELMSHAADGHKAHLPEPTVERVIELQDFLSAKEIRLSVSPDGSQFTVGPSSSDHATVDFDELSYDEDEFSLILQGNMLSRALNQIEDYSEADLIVTGSDAIVAVRAGAYTYVLTPMEED